MRRRSVGTRQVLLHSSAAWAMPEQGRQLGDGVRDINGRWGFNKESAHALCSRFADVSAGTLVDNE